MAIFFIFPKRFDKFNFCFLEGMLFEKQNVKISGNSPVLSDLIASQFQVCGKLHGNVVKDETLFISISKDAEDSGTLLPVDREGDFCTYLNQGIYRLRVHLSEEQRNQGFRYRTFRN